MKLEEYKEWLKKKGNYEEVAAYKVAKKIVDWHTSDIDCSKLDVEVYPRHVLSRKDLLSEKEERIEFDLVIKLVWTTTKGRRYERLIGVEFKEYDMRKVVIQAIRRRDFVDYMYVATRNIVVDYTDLFYLADFGIGWLIYDDDGFVKMLIPAKYSYGSGVYELLKSLAEKAVNEVLEDIRRRRNTILFEFVE